MSMAPDGGYLFCCGTNRDKRRNNEVFFDEKPVKNRVMNKNQSSTEDDDLSFVTTINKQWHVAGFC